MGEADRAWDRSWEKEAVRGRDRIKELEAFDSSWQQVVAKRDARIKELEDLGRRRQGIVVELRDKANRLQSRLDAVARALAGKGE